MNNALYIAKKLELGLERFHSLASSYSTLSKECHTLYGEQGWSDEIKKAYTTITEPLILTRAIVFFALNDDIIPFAVKELGVIETRDIVSHFFLSQEDSNIQSIAMLKNNTIRVMYDYPTSYYEFIIKEEY